MPKVKRDPALEVACPRCDAPAGRPCVSSGGTERRNASHSPRIEVNDAQRRLNRKGLRSERPGEYIVKELVDVERNELDPGVPNDALVRSRFTGRSVVDNYIVETVLSDSGAITHTIERDGQQWILVARVAEELQRQRRRLTEAKIADAKAEKVLTKYARSVDEQDCS